MLTIQMTRTRKSGNAVFGKMVLPFSKYPNKDREDPDYSIDTLENADYIIPAGTYKIDVTWSPKFKKFLPILEDVPERSGIRIHKGTKPEHSEGCILTDEFGMSTFNAFYNRLTIYYDEEILLQISDDLSILPCPGSGSGQ